VAVDGAGGPRVYCPPCRRSDRTRYGDSACDATPPEPR